MVCRNTVLQKRPQKNPKKRPLQNRIFQIGSLYDEELYRLRQENEMLRKENEMLRYMLAKEKSRLAAVRKKAELDSVTGLGSKKAFDRFLSAEFVVVIPCDTPGIALCVAEKIREAIENDRVTAPDGREFRYTASIGVSFCESPSMAKEAVISADAALYSAKLSGKNRVETGVSISAEKECA